jgi:diguanylate cyclase (GGDEF)-like protein
LFLDRVDHARTQQNRDSTTLGVLFVDLDNFKTVNDTKGHLAGDAVLREVGTRIGAVLRPGDTLARLGGDEFVVLLSGVEGPQDVTAVAERVLEAVASAELVQEIGVSPSASIGVVIEPAPGTRTSAELLRDADIAMYSAKRNSKGGYEIFDTTMREDLQALQALRNDLRRAMGEEELFLQYQPIVRISDGAVKGFESLIRWRHPERGLVPPLSFIPVAEESGQILEIGRWMLRRACLDAAGWQRRFPREQPLLVSVNVSPVQVRDPGFIDTLEGTLSEFELAPNSLVLEITEGLLVLDAPTVGRRLREIKSLGIRIAIDDFGTGYSSLGYLHRFPIDLLKIDKLFIDSITQATRASALARAVVQLGETLGIGVVAEGVESNDQADALREMGCAFAQGHLYSEPVDGDRVATLLDEAAYSTAATPAPGR